MMAIRFLFFYESLNVLFLNNETNFLNHSNFLIFA